MSGMDCNCFVGGWPFHRVRRSTFRELAKLHAENRIDGGFVSSTDALFYNDPYEADQLLGQELAGSQYRHVMTVNPLLPGTRDDLLRAKRHMDVYGVRIVPGLHGYTLDDGRIGELMELLEQLRLPLFLTLHLEDDRVTYLLHPRIPAEEEVDGFLRKYAAIPTMLCNIQMHEMYALSDAICSRGNVCADCSGFKDGLYVIEELTCAGFGERLAYGSMAPIFCLKSSLMGVESARIPEEQKQRILSGDAVEEFLQYR